MTGKILDGPGREGLFRALSEGYKVRFTVQERSGSFDIMATIESIEVEKGNRDCCKIGGTHTRGEEEPVEFTARYNSSTRRGDIRISS